MIAPGQEDYETTWTFTVKALLDRKHIHVVWIAIYTKWPDNYINLYYGRNIKGFYCCQCKENLVIN
jgi:hypothetical protein